MVKNGGESSILYIQTKSFENKYGTNNLLKHCLLPKHLLGDHFALNDT